MTARGRRKWFATAALAALPALALLGLLLAPLIRLLLEAFGSGSDVTGAPASIWLPWQDDYLRWRVLWSLAQAGATCGLALLLGVPLAWVLARLEFGGRVWVLRALMLPFVVPTLVAALGVLALWGPQGLFSGWLSIDLQGTPWLLLYGNLFFNLCLVVRAGVEALQRVSATQLAAARSLGATPWRAFWRVEWPAMAPWLAASLCLVFLYCFAGFGLALLLGGPRYATVEVEIYSLVAHELQLGQASVLALWMLLLNGTVALAYAWLERRLGTPQSCQPVPRVRPQGSAGWLALALAMAVLALLCLAPVLAIVWRGLSLGWLAWQQLFDDEVVAALANTLRFSGLALLMSAVLGVLHALTAQTAVLWRAAAMLPFVISPVTAALGLLLLYPQATASLWLLLGAYAVLAYPFVAQSMAAALDAMPVHLLQAARTLGASPWRCFWRVTLPVLAPALRRGLAFAGATAVGEFAVTLFLSRPEWATLTTLIYQRLGRPGQDNLDAAMALACVLMLLALLLFAAIDGLGSADGFGQQGTRAQTRSAHA